MTRFFAVFLHELKYHLAGKALWIFYSLLGAFALFAASSEDMAVSPVASVNLNAPYNVTILVTMMTLFSLFILAAAVAGSVTRDFDTRYGDILAATPVAGTSLVLGRFFGSISAVLIGFWLVLAMLAVAKFMPWADDARMGPVPWLALCRAYVILTIPILLSLGAVLFALATVFRTMAATLIGVVVIVGGYIAAFTNRFMNNYQDLIMRLDPTGLVITIKQSEYWTIAQRNSGYLIVTNQYLENRLIWGAIAVAALILSMLLYQRGMRESSRHLKAGKNNATPAPLDARNTVKLSSHVSSPTNRLAQLTMRTSHDLGWLLKSASFWILMAVCVLVAGSSLVGVGEQNGATIEPVTRLLVRSLEDVLQPMMWLIAAYYGGATVWRERDGRVHELVGATGVSDWMFVLPKILAVTIAVFLMTVAAMLAGIISQIVKGYVAPDMINWVAWWIIPSLVGAIQIACLSVFLQAVSPNRLVGWGALLLVLAGPELLASHWGGDHSLLQFSFSPDVALSDFNGMAHFWIMRLWYQLYWGALSVGLLILAWAFWKRGAETRFKPRFESLKEKIRGPVLASLVAASCTFIGVGGWIFYNTNIANHYMTSAGADAYQADIEKQLGKYAQMPMPVVIDVKLDVDIDTGRHIAVAKGRYILENQTAMPLSQLVINWPGTEPTKLTVEGASREIDMLKEHVFEVWRFKTPIQPSEKRVVTFEVTEDQSAFSDSGPAKDIVENGTYLPISKFAPEFALSDSYFHSDPTKRRKFGLPPKSRMPNVNDAFAKTHSLYTVDAGFVSSDITVTLPADQIVIVPGQQISQTTQNGRTTTRFVSQAPMSKELAVLSARYVVHTEQISANGKPVTLSIYHLPSHAKNIARMARSARISLDLFAKTYGPYQFSTLKIVEVPGYGGDVAAIAMPGVIPFFEDIGWLQTNRAGDLLDNVSSTTAHEIAHMWWGHQVSPSSNAGAQVLTESLAEYSANYAMIFVRSYNQALGELSNSMALYRQERGSDAIGENPLGQMEGQDYLAYQRGAATFWLLKDQLGHEVLHKALSEFLSQYRYAKSRFPGTPELIATLKRAANPDQQKLIDMLFNKIVFFDFDPQSATARSPKNDTNWLVSLEVNPIATFFAGDGSELDTGIFSGVADISVAESLESGKGMEAYKVNSLVSPRVPFSGQIWPEAPVSGLSQDWKPKRVSVAPDINDIWFSVNGNNQWLTLERETKAKTLPTPLTPPPTPKAKP